MCCTHSFPWFCSFPLLRCSTTTGIQICSTNCPKEVAFISWIPWVSGNRETIFCITPGMTSKGSVAPENISIGKYSALAITLAIFSFQDAGRTWSREGIAEAVKRLLRERMPLFDSLIRQIDEYPSISAICSAENDISIRNLAAYFFPVKSEERKAFCCAGCRPCSGRAASRAAFSFQRRGQGALFSRCPE